MLLEPHTETRIWINGAAVAPLADDPVTVAKRRALEREFTAKGLLDAITAGLTWTAFCAGTHDPSFTPDEIETMLEDFFTGMVLQGVEHG